MFVRLPTLSLECSNPKIPSLSVFRKPVHLNSILFTVMPSTTDSTATRWHILPLSQAFLPYKNGGTVIHVISRLCNYDHAFPLNLYVALTFY